MLNSRVSDAANPLDYNADPTGGRDSAAAISRAAGMTANGMHLDVHLPAGIYHVAHQLNIGPGQCLYGDGRANTVLTVGPDFDPGAKGVIVLTGRELEAPCVHDLAMRFAQPKSQFSRANFKTLAQKCSVGTNGSGCKYPPAVYIGNSDRFTLSKLWIVKAWDGIVNSPGNNLGGFFMEDVDVGALDVGLAVSSGKDFCHIRGYHFGPYEITGDSPTLYKGVYRDGNTFAARIGECDGLSAVDLEVFEGRIALTNDFSWGTFTDLKLDGDNSTFEVAADQWLQLQGVYATGAASGANRHCQIDIASGNKVTLITNAFLSSLCVRGGDVSLSGGDLSPVYANATAIQQTGGSLAVRDVAFRPWTWRGAWTVPVVASTGGTLIFQNNDFSPSKGDVGAVAIAHDNPGNMVTGNQFNGWKFTPPGRLGTYGPNGR